MTSSWNGYSTQCMITSLCCILLSLSSVNSYIGIHATHSWRQIKIKSSSPSVNGPIGIHATHSWRQIKIKSSSPSVNGPISIHATHSWWQIKIKSSSSSANEPLLFTINPVKTAEPCRPCSFLILTMTVIRDCANILKMMISPNLYMAKIFFSPNFLSCSMYRHPFKMDLYYDSQFCVKLSHTWIMLV